MRRLLVAACAAIALVLACATGEPRGAVAVDDESSDVASATDLFEALPPSAALEVASPPPSGAVFIDLHFPTSRMTTADVFRPPQG